VPKTQGNVQIFEDNEPFKPWIVVHIDHVTKLPATTRDL
jgi:hypothetical protein